MSSATLDSVDAVVVALGGSRKVRELAGWSSQQLWNCRNIGRFPATSHALFQDELRRLGLEASPVLWRQEIGVVAAE